MVPLSAVAPAPVRFLLCSFFPCFIFFVFRSAWVCVRPFSGSRSLFGCCPDPFRVSGNRSIVLLFITISVDLALLTLPKQCPGSLQETF